MPGNYKGITLMSNFCKLLSASISQRNRLAANVPHEFQAAFKFRAGAQSIITSTPARACARQRSHAA